MNAALQPSLLSRASAALRQGAFTEVKALCAAHLRGNPNDAHALFLMGSAAANLGETGDAILLLERARIVAPRNIAVLTALGAMCAAGDRLEQARAVLEDAVTIDRRYPLAQQNLGAVYNSLALPAKAKEAFRRTLTIDPQSVEAMAGLANIAEKDDDFEEAERLIQRALSLAPEQPFVQEVAARIELRTGRAQAAAERLQTLLGKIRQPRNRVAPMFALGSAEEALGHFEKAFTAFAAGNRITQTLEAARFATSREATAPATVEAVTAFVESTDVTGWTKAPPVEGLSPTFFVGFPRSGTTLMEQVLASHPDIETMEERECLLDAFPKRLLEPDGYAQWATLSEDEIVACRTAYWDGVTAVLGHKPAGRAFIDRAPLSTVLLPHIHRIFPTAKILFMVRDPRDAVMSCFKQNFALNPGMFQFTALDTTVAYYDQVLRLWEASSRVLPLEAHVFHYESLVRDFDATTAAVLNHIGVPWDDSVREYQKTAKAQAIRTPSASQVVKPIYNSAVGSWRPYAEQLAPYRETLDSWAERFGYARA